MIVADSPICASFSIISTNLEEFIKIISIKVTKGTVCLSEIHLASCPACPPGCPPAGYPQPGSSKCWNWLVRSVTSLPDVQATCTKYVSPQGLGKAIYLKWEWQTFFLGYWENDSTEVWEATGKVLARVHQARPAEKKPCSVRPSARHHRGRETGASSTLFTNREPWSDRRAVGLAGDQIHPGLFSCWCNTLFTLLLFSARLPTKPKLAY